MKLSGRLRTRVVWGLGALLSVTGLALLAVDVARSAATKPGVLVLTDAAWGLIPVMFPLLAALILTHQPRNVIAWLLLVPAVLLIITPLGVRYLASFAEAPATLTLPLYLLIWFFSWGWLAAIFPLVLIPLYFPTGRPPSKRWGWVGVATVAEALIFMLLQTFSQPLTPVSADGVTWSVPNPIGFLTEQQVEPMITVWVMGLVLCVVLCVTSLFVRYRRAGAVERTQIKWLLYACGLFVLVYLPPGFMSLETATGERAMVGYLFDLALVAALLAIAGAIAVAVVRYRLWDIDVVIRRTLIYSVLTGVLALAYLGSVLVLQGVSRLFTGEDQNSLVVVLSTLAIAALFVPLRRRVQAVIDRRFYRQKYDAARTLAAFAVGARDETDLERLSEHLLEVVGDAMQPEQVSLWLKAAPHASGRGSGATGRQKAPAP